MLEPKITQERDSKSSPSTSRVQHDKLLTMMEWRDRAICISEVSKTIAAISNLNVFVRRLYKAMRNALLCDTFAIYLVDVYEKQLVEIASMFDINAAPASGPFCLPKDIGRTQIIMRDNNPETIDIDNPRQDEYIPDELKELDYKMILTVPLLVESESIGIYCAIFKETLPVTTADLEYALLLGSVVGSMISDIEWANKTLWGTSSTRMTTPSDVPHMGGRMQLSRDDLAAQLDSFTEREWEIMELIADGLSNQEIASTVYLSEGTIKKYISNLMQKAGATNRVQIAVMVLEKRFLAGEL